MKNLFYSLIILLTFSSPGLAQTADEFNTKGMEFFKEGKINEAIQEFQSAIKQDTTFVKAYVNLGYIYYANGILDYAIPLVLNSSAVCARPGLLNVKRIISE